MKNSDNKVSDRVSHYRIRNKREGMKRVETTVSAGDVNLVKDVAKVLRAGGPLAVELRQSIRSMLPAVQASTGEELLVFFQTSPLREEDEHVFDDVRDRSTERTVDFE